ncbi:hypothetical protein YC2023_114093 [Brassica napus]
MQSGDRRGQSSRRQGHEPQTGENILLDVPTLLRRAADAYEERVMPMFEGYVLSLKGHFNREVGVLRTDLQSATTSIREMETAVTTEFENIEKLITGPGTTTRNHRSVEEVRIDSILLIAVQSMTLETHFFSPAKVTGTASAPLYAASTASPGVSKSGEYNVQLCADIRSMQTQGQRGLSPDPPPPSVPHTKFTDSGPVDVDSHGVLPGDKDTASKGPVTSNIHPPPTQSTGHIDDVVVEPMETHTHDSHEASPQDPLPPVSQSDTVPDVSGVVNQILSDAGISKEIPQTSTFPGDVVGGECQSSNFDRLNEQELPRPSPPPATVAGGPSVSSKFVSLKEKETTSHGGEMHGSNPVEEASELGFEKNDDVDGSSNSSPTKFKGVGDVPGAGDAAGDGGRRAFKRAKKTANASSNPTPPTRVLPVFIGGFNAFAPPTQANRDAFLKRLTTAKSVDDSSGSGYSISSLGPLFHCNGVCSHEALDRVVNLIRNRRDRLPYARFEFVPPSFFLELMRNYAGFEAIKEKHKFAFSTPLKPQFLHRPGWYTQVDFIYSPFLIKKTHWVGLIVDLKMAALYVVDSNSACPYTVDVTSYLSPIATMLPHLVSRYCIVPNPCEMNFRPFPISQIEVPVLLEHPGFSAVAALILLEMAAADQPLNSLSLSEEEVRVAAENYAIAALSMG